MSKRKSIHDLSLKNRKFIGNTSMDAELSLIMVNHAKISQSDLVFDPFVGSGKLLQDVAGAYLLTVFIFIHLVEQDHFLLRLLIAELMFLVLILII